MLNKELLGQQLSELPLYQYAFLKSEDLVFTERVRHICRTECSMYGTTWACPPAVGTVSQCREACLATRRDHEDVTRQVAQLMREQGCELRVLSTESCAICGRCAYPDGPCRHPELMFPCVESQGILVTDLAEKCGMDFFNGNIVTWFSVLLYR